MARGAGRPKKPDHKFVPISECKKMKTERACLVGQINMASKTVGFNPQHPGKLPTATFLTEHFKKQVGKLSRNTVSAAMKLCAFVGHLARTKNNKKSAKKEEIRKRRIAVKKAVKQVTVVKGVRRNTNPTAAAVKKAAELDVSVRTILRDHYANGGKVYHPQKRPYMVKHIPDRLAFCAAILKMSQVEISKIVFSDECVITANRSSSGSVLAFSRNAVEPTITQRKHNLYYFQIFCAVGIGYKSPLILVPKEYKESTRNPGTFTKTVIKHTLNSESYISSALKPLKKDLKGKYFQQDGASMHHSETTTAWLKRNGIKRLEDTIGARWPASSPDFNMIELVWANLKRRISAMDDAESEEDLVAKTRQAWEEMPQEEIDDTVRHFVRAVKAWHDQNKKK